MLNSSDNHVRLSGYVLEDAFSILKKLFDVMRTLYKNEQKKICSNMDYYQDDMSKKICGTRLLLQYIKDETKYDCSSYWVKSIFKEKVDICIRELEILVKQYTNHPIIIREIVKITRCECGSMVKNIEKHIKTKYHNRRLVSTSNNTT